MAGDCTFPLAGQGLRERVACPACRRSTLNPMAWRIEQQSDGRFAIYSTRIHDYITIDADALEIERIYAEKGVKVYLASARAQMTSRVVSVSSDGETKIAATRARGAAPKEGEVPIGVTGFVLDDE